MASACFPSSNLPCPILVVILLVILEMASSAPSPAPTPDPTMGVLLPSGEPNKPDVSTTIVFAIFVASAAVLVVAGLYLLIVCFSGSDPDPDAPLVTFFSTYAGDGQIDEDDTHPRARKSQKASLAPPDITREGAIYTWAKQFHAKSVVRGTPTGQGLAQAMIDVEKRQARELLDGSDEPKAAKFGERPVPLVPGGATALQSLSPKDRLDTLEQIAVDMARKQQELVVALTISEEKQQTLHEELEELRLQKAKEAMYDHAEAAELELVAPTNSNTSGKGFLEETSEFVNGWLRNGALVDAKLQEPPRSAADKTPAAANGRRSHKHRSSSSKGKKGRRSSSSGKSKSGRSRRDRGPSSDGSKSVTSHGTEMV